MASADLWYVGIGLEILSTMSGTIGKQAIRMSETTKEKNPRCSRILFATGLAVNTAVGPIIDMGAYSFAPQSLIAPFGGLDVVWNAILAPWVLKETLTVGRAMGCIFIVLGTGLAGMFGNHYEPEYTVEYLEETLLSYRVLIYFSCFFVWFMLNRFIFMQYGAGTTIRGLSLGCTAGTIAGNMFCVKAAIELIQRSIHGPDGTIWLTWLPYTMLVGAAFFALSNVVFMTKGLQEYEALFMVTIYEGSMIVSGCLSGAIVLKDLRDLETWRVCVYASGVLTIVFGMWVIFMQESKQKSSFVAGEASIVTSPQRSPGAQEEHNPISIFAAVSPMRDEEAGITSPKSKKSSPSRESSTDTSPSAQEGKLGADVVGRSQDGSPQIRQPNLLEVAADNKEAQENKGEEKKGEEDDMHLRL